MLEEALGCGVQGVLGDGVIFAEGDLEVLFSGKWVLFAEGAGVLGLL